MPMPVINKHEAERQIYDLGFKHRARSIQEILETQSATEVGTLLNPKIIWRERLDPDPVARGKILADTDCCPGADILVTEKNDFLIIPLDLSCIVLSGKSVKFGIELTVLRGIGVDSPAAGELYEWLASVVDTACGERRDVRPMHPGKMVQVGYNAGPRHARVYGLAKSWTKKLDSETMVEHDEDAIAAMSLTWSICCAFLPKNITSTISQFLEDAGLPRIATRNVAEGTGYTLCLGERSYQFPFFERAPPEGILSQDYSAVTHTDPSYADWGLSWNVDRRVDNMHPGSADGAPPFRHTRQHTAAASSPMSTSAVPETQRLPGGGHFVDNSLKVKVLQDRGTLIGFHPSYYHGTTRLCGAHNSACTIPFSQRLYDAYQKANQGISVVAAAGAGEQRLGPKYG